MMVTLLNVHKPNEPERERERANVYVCVCMLIYSYDSGIAFFVMNVCAAVDNAVLVFKYLLLTSQVVYKKKKHFCVPVLSVCVWHLFKSYSTKATQVN